jgi:hypothetical protein
MGNHDKVIDLEGFKLSLQTDRVTVEGCQVVFRDARGEPLEILVTPSPEAARQALENFMAKLAEALEPRK